MITILLIVHGLLAMALVGAITHQALATCWPGRGAGDFVTRFRSVTGPAYTNAVIVLFVATFLVGALIYPAYRLGVRNYLQSFRLFTPEGAFEVKEHFISIGLGLLPVYWLVWRQPSTEWGRVRDIVTAMLAIVIWLAFLVGHVLNNIRGLFGA